MYWLATLMLAVSGAGSLDRKSSHPIMFTNAGNIIFSGTNYLVPISLDTEQLLSMSAPIIEGLRQTQDHFDYIDSYASQVGRGDTHEHFVKTHLPQSFRSHIKMLLKDLEARTNDLSGILDTIGSHRPPPSGGALLDSLTFKKHSKMHKRSPFNFLGDAGSFLFGLATQDQLEQVKEMFDSLQDLTSQERTQLNIHKQILNVTNLHLESLQASQEKTFEAIRALDYNLKNLNATLTNGLTEIPTINSNLEIVSTISYCSSAITDYDFIVSRFITGLNSMNRGVLSSEILPLSKLTEIIAGLSQSNLRPLWPATPEFINYYYKFVSVLPVNDNKLSFVALLPLLSHQNANLHLYSVKNLPIPCHTKLDH